MASPAASWRGLEHETGPLTDLFPPATHARDLLRHQLGPELQAAFARDGFVGGIPVLDARQLAAVRQHCDQLVAALPELEPRLHEVEQGYRERPDAVVCHFLGAWRVDPVFHDLVSAPAVTVPLAQLLGVARLRFWHDQVFHKPARHAGVVPWHQDYSYWTRTTPPCHITLNVMLDDTDPDNGCVHFVPGSQRWPLLPRTAFDGDMDTLVTRLPAELRAGFRPVPVPLRAGHASIHHSHTLHGSFANRSARPRRAVVLNYMGPDTRCADPAPLLRGAAPIPVGARIEGPLFPIVLDRERLP